MDKYIRKGFIVLTLGLACLAGGCGKDKEETVQAQSKEYVYSFTSLNEQVQDMELSQVLYAGDSIFLTGYRFESVPMTEEAMDGDMAAAAVKEESDDAMEEAIAEEVSVDAMAAEADEEVYVDDMAEVAEEVYVDDMAPNEEYIGEEEYYEPTMENSYLQVKRMDTQGNLLSEYELLLDPESGLYSFCVDDDANSYQVLCEYGKDLSNPNYARDVYTLLSYTENGEERFRVPLAEDLGEEEWYYVNQMLCDQKNLYLLSSKGLEIYDMEGNFIKVIQSDFLENAAMYILADGSIAFSVYGNNGRYMKTLDTEKEEFSDQIKFPFNSDGYSFYAGKSKDLLLTNNIGIYAYDLQDEGLEKIADFVDSDILCSDLSMLVEIGEGQYFGSFYDNDSWQLQYGIFNKVDPETIQDKKVLTLACYWLDDEVRKRVVDYNKASTEYRIRVEDYHQYNTADDYNAGMTKMNTDIASGNAPDIMILSADMPVDSYISKGLLADMRPFLENDPELKIEDYSSHIMELYSQDGKWYQMVPSYYLYTLFGKTSDVGKEPGWTLDELRALWDKKEDDVAVFSEMTQQGFLNYCMLFASGEFVDWGKGECYFDSEEFIKLLEFTKGFPTEIYYDNIEYDEEYWQEQETLFRNGKALLQPYALSGFDDFKYCEQGTFGEEITAIGFPVQEGVGSVIMANTDYAISAKSPYQQEVWNFLRYYLTPEYQDTIEYGWPILNSAMEKKVERAKEASYYTDEEGNQVEYNDTYYIGGMEIEMKPLTQEDCDRVLGFIESAEHAYSYNDTILGIVTEEAAPFFEGKKTAEEVTGIIQSRVDIYVNENK